MNQREIVKETVRTMDLRYGILFSTQEACNFVQRHPELVKCIAEVGEIETCVRGFMAELLAKDLGLLGGWPKGADSDEYARAFFITLGARLQEQGYRLRADCSLWKDLNSI